MANEDGAASPLVAGTMHAGGGVWDDEGDEGSGFFCLGSLCTVDTDPVLRGDNPYQNAQQEMGVYYKKLRKLSKGTHARMSMFNDRLFRHINTNTNTDMDPYRRKHKWLIDTVSDIDQTVHNFLLLLGKVQKKEGASLLIWEDMKRLLDSKIPAWSQGYTVANVVQRDIVSAFSMPKTGYKPTDAETDVDK